MVGLLVVFWWLLACSLARSRTGMPKEEPVCPNSELARDSARPEPLVDSCRCGDCSHHSPYRNHNNQQFSFHALRAEGA